jgi:hypothetical protein
MPVGEWVDFIADNVQEVPEAARPAGPRA